MTSSLIFAALKFLPTALEYGVPMVKALIENVNATQKPKGEIEEYAARALDAIPAMMAAGVAINEVVAISKRTNEEVGAMIREARGPTDEERSSQAQRIARLEGRLDTAAKPR